MKLDCALIVIIIILLVFNTSSFKSKFTCLPDGNCPLTTAFSGNQLPCENAGIYWIQYSRLIDGKQAWALTDANGWPLDIEVAKQQISPGDMLCWAGQSMAYVVGLATHKNIPYTTFILLDRTFEIDLSGKLVNILKPNVSSFKTNLPTHSWFKW